MKKVFLFGLLGLFSVVTALEAEAGCRHRCGGRHQRRGCNTGCYVQPSYSGGCQTNGYMNGNMNGGAYVDPAVDPNVPVVPAEPQPVNP